MNRVVRFTSTVLVLLSCTVFNLFQIMQPASTAPASAIEASPVVNVAKNIDYG
jgi:hypothetical protein